MILKIIFPKQQRAAQAGQQQMAGMQNMRANQGMPNAMGNVMPNVVGNVMQQGNAMPPGSMNANNMNINMGKKAIDNWFLSNINQDFLFEFRLVFFQVQTLVNKLMLGVKSQIIWLARSHKRCPCKEFELIKQ